MMSPAVRAWSAPGGSATWGRRGVAAVAGLVFLAALLVFGQRPAFAASLTGLTWTSSSLTTSASDVTYGYGFTDPSGLVLTSFTMTVPPGTGGTPTLGSFTIGGVTTTGTVALSGGVLTVTLLGLLDGGVVAMQINGLVNTPTTGIYHSVITANRLLSSDTGPTPSLGLNPGILVTPTWTSSSNLIGASAAYTFAFTTGSASTLHAITITVPSGTKGTPTVGTVTPAALAAGGQVTLAGAALTYAFTPTTSVVPAATPVSVTVGGLVNTTTVGSYTSSLATVDVGGTSPGLVDTGTAPALSLVGQLALVSPSSLSWSLTLNGQNQSVVDLRGADQQFSVTDTTGSGAGWHVTASATTLTSGTDSLPTAGTLVYTGSLVSSAAVSAPTSSCVGTCTLPVDRATYPVVITTAASSPPASTIYDAAAGSGLGAVTIGAAGSADPGGWWVAVPANTFRGTYTSTITLAIVTGP
jgi:WxL domain surface cell wall-binding